MLIRYQSRFRKNKAIELASLGIRTAKLIALHCRAKPEPSLLHLRSRSVEVITSALHAEGPRFEPGRDQPFYYVTSRGTRRCPEFSYLQHEALEIKVFNIGAPYIVCLVKVSPNAPVAHTRHMEY